MSDKKPPQRRWLAAVVAGAVGLAVLVYVSIEIGDVSTGAALLAIVAATLVGALYWLGRAVQILFDETAPTNDETLRVEGRLRRELQREKRLLLKALAEVELDYDLGKLSEKDYREASANYRARIARIFRQLDAGSDYEALVAEELKRRRRTAASAPDKQAEAELAASKAAAKAKVSEEPAAASADAASDQDPAASTSALAPAEEAAAAPAAPSGKQCGKCKTKNDADAEFCKKCGTAIA